MSIRTAMLLSAGLGTRMRPITETLPKPLIRISGRSLLDYALDHLEAAGVERVVVNTHWLGEQIETHLAGRTTPAITVSREATLLETGGGVVQALPQLGPDPFFVVNADVLWLNGTLPALDRLAAAWDPQRMDALLLLNRTVTAIGYDGAGDYFADQVGRLTWRRPGEVAPHVYAGAHILHPRVLGDGPPTKFSLKRTWDAAEEAGRLYGIMHDGLWFHLGKPDDIAEAQAYLDERRLLT